MAESIREFGGAVDGVDYILRLGGYLVTHNARGEIAVLATPRGFFLPGGGQHPQESPAQAALREAIEECGLQVRLNGWSERADELVWGAAEQKHFRKRCVFFGAEVVGHEGSCEDGYELLWLPANEAITRLSHQSQAWAVQQITGKATE